LQLAMRKIPLRFLRPFKFVALSCGPESCDDTI
jgi:hypothetical protein